MSLTLYKKKRIFSQTPEPEGKKQSSTDTLRFVVQKHAASRLHYDFRLELQGVLKSWAIPKGPSSNPEDKRLAMMVEDHPFDYRSFEGIIPEGNYGAGTVMVWDEGTYEALGYEGEPKEKQEKILLRELKEGDMKIVLHGKKLKGAYALVKLKKNSDNSWLLIKKADKYASQKDITKKDKSVISERTLDEITNDSDSNVYGSNKKNNQVTKKKTDPELIKTTVTLTKRSTSKKKFLTLNLF
jgi:bifunctional non-homologous end joining protein LigD